MARIMASSVYTSVVAVCVLAILTEAYVAKKHVDSCPNVDSLLCEESCEAKDIWKPTTIVLDNGKECQGCPICTEPPFTEAGGCPSLPCSLILLPERCNRDRVHFFNHVTFEVNDKECTTCGAIECFEEESV